MAGSKAKSGKKGIDQHRGKWRYRFQLKGEQVRVLTDLAATIGNLGEAARLRDEHKARLILGQPTATRRLKIIEATDVWFRHVKQQHKAKPATAARKVTAMASWRVFLGDIDAADLTARRIDDYMLWRRESKITETTLRKNCLACREFCKWARRQEIMTADPWDGIKLPVEGPGNEVILDAQQERAYLIHAAKHPAVYDLALLMLRQGLRPNEALNLRKDDIELDARLLHVRQSKTPSGIRSLPLTDETYAVLAKRTGTPGPWIFSGFRRRPDSGRLMPDPSVRLTYSGIINAHNRICIAAGLDFCIYSLRHTFATRFYEVTKDLAALKDVLGHSRISMVMRYVHDRAERIRSSMAAFEAGTRKEVSRRPS